MNVEDMSAEQLMAAAEAKAGEESPAPSTREVEIAGHRVVIDIAKLQTWRAFKLIRKIDSGNDLEKVDGAIAFAEFVSDKDEDDIVEMMGGDDATTVDVVQFAMSILTECYPKN